MFFVLKGLPKQAPFPLLNPAQFDVATGFWFLGAGTGGTGSGTAGKPRAVRAAA